MAQLSIIKGENSPIDPQFLHKTFEELVEQKCGNKTALIYDDGNKKVQTTYKTLNSDANRIALALLEKIQTNNLKHNSDGDWLICVCMKPSDNLVTAILSIWKCGGKKN